MSVLLIKGLRAGIAGREILRGIDLEVRTNEVHAVMGPNGAGKSTLGNVLMGHPGYEVLGGSVTLDGVDLLRLPTFERARAGLFLAPQDPVELPGVPLSSVVLEALFDETSAEQGLEVELKERLVEEAARVRVAPAMLDRALNVDSSGGEKKRMETLQLAMIRPRIAILDELDSGLDVDALREIARRVDSLVHDSPSGLGVLVITHYRRLLTELKPDGVHVLVNGQILESGGPELAVELERSGYGSYATSAV